MGTAAQHVAGAVGDFFCVDGVGPLAFAEARSAGGRPGEFVDQGAQPGRQSLLSDAYVMHLCCERTSAFLRFLSDAANRQEVCGFVKRLGIASVA